MNYSIKIIITTLCKAFDVHTIVNCLLSFGPFVSVKLVPIDKVGVPFFDASHGPICQIP